MFRMKVIEVISAKFSKRSGACGANLVLVAQTDFCVHRRRFRDKLNVSKISMSFIDR